MNIRIKPGQAKGQVVAPPSKSYAHRLLICAALAKGESLVKGIAKSQDILATLDCIRALGATDTEKETCLLLRGGNTPPQGIGDFPCRESGSTLRFFIPLALACLEGGRFTGSSRLLERGVGVYESLFAQKGIAIRKKNGALMVQGELLPGEYILPGDVSSQFVSGLLFALPLLKGESLLRVLPPVESEAYFRITIAALALFGVQVEEIAPYTFRIPGAQTYQPREIQVEGDWSNAAFFLALEALGNAVTVTGLNPQSLQGDKIAPALFQELSSPNGGGTPINLSSCPDLAPILFAFAAAKAGGHFLGTRRLKIKESDRAQAMAEELRKFGLCLDIQENEVIVPPGGLQKPKEILCGHNDHRIVMALAVLATLTGATITDGEAVEKSFPNFFQILQDLGLEIEYGV